MGKSEQMPWFAYYASKYSPVIRILNREQLADLLLAIDSYAVDGVIKEIDPVTNMVFTLIKTDIDDSKIQYEEKCETNRQNALKRWAKNPDAVASDGMRLHAVASDGMPLNANDAKPSELCESCTIENNTLHNNTLDINGKNKKRYTISQDEYGIPTFK